MIGAMWKELSTACFGAPLENYETHDGGHLPSVYAVSDFADATVALAGTALARLSGGSANDVCIDRRRASLWFDMTVQPQGWDAPNIWDAIAGVYACKDGWIRLHTNAPHHRDAALSVLGVEPDRNAVSSAVATWTGIELESAIVAANGCAAELRSADQWMLHPHGRTIADAPLIAWRETGSCEARELDAEAPLKGVKVLDLTRVLAGPVATRFLAGWGADVVRIDPPFWEEEASELEVTLGKRCAGLDLRKAADLDTLKRLMSEADVLVHGYRADALERMGLGDDARREINSSLVDIALNAYGWTGPWRNRRGFDSLVQMSCGIAHQGMVQIGTDGPKPLPVQALDHGTGYLLAAAALEGLNARQSGRVMSARLSLARTAHTLMQYPTDYDEDGAISLTDGDLNVAIEETSWGPARRVAPPLTVSGVAPAWQIPAGYFRRHTATWGGDQ